MSEESLSSILVDVGGDATGLTKTIATVKALMEGDMAGALEGAVEIAKGLAEEFEKAFEYAAEVIKESVKAAADHQVAMTDLSSAFAHAGMVGKQAADDFQQFAAQLQRSSRFTDDQIDSSAALAVSFGITGDRLKQATTGAADLSSRFHVDLSSAMMKIIQGMETGSISFGRMHLQMSKVAGQGVDLATVLNNVSAIAGGSAAAAAGTYSGSLDIMTNSWDDAHKALGDAIIDNTTVRAIIAVATKQIDEMTEFIKKNQSTISSWIDKGWNILSKAIEVSIALAYGLNVEFVAMAGPAVKALQLIVDAVDNGLQVVLSGTIDLINLVIAGLNKIPGVNITPLNAQMASVIAQMADGRQAVDDLAAGMDLYSKKSVTGLKGLFDWWNSTRGEVGKVKTGFDDAAKAGDEVGKTGPKLDIVNKSAETLSKTLEKIAQQDAAQVGNALGATFGAIAAGTEKSSKAFIALSKTMIQTIRQAAIQAIEAYAASSAGAAYFSQAGIPIIGPILAVAAAGAAFSFVEAYMGKFHTGGIVGGNLGSDANVARVEKNEIILPAPGVPMDSRLRDAAMARLGGGHTLNVNVLESSFVPRTEADFIKLIKIHMKRALEELTANNEIRIASSINYGN